MEHLFNHPHALLDSNNKVINIAAFDGHDHPLIEAIKEANNATNTVCCCDNGIAVMGGSWNGSRFLNEEGNLMPLTEAPTDAIYEWDESILGWKWIRENIKLPESENIEAPGSEVY